MDEQFDKTIKRVNRRTSVGIWLSSIVYVSLGIYVYFNSKKNGNGFSIFSGKGFILIFTFGIMMLMTWFIIISLSSKKDIQKLESIYFETVVLPTYQKEFENVREGCDIDIDGLVMGTNLLKSGSDTKVSGTIRGSYKGVDFIRSSYLSYDLEINATGAPIFHTIFEGRWIILQMKEKQPDDLYLMSKKLNTLSKKMSFELKFERFDTGQEQFDKAYKVYTKNKEFAQDFLSEERLGMLTQRNPKLDFGMYVSGDMVYIATTEGHKATDFTTATTSDKGKESSELYDEISDIKRYIELFCMS